VIGESVGSFSIPTSTTCFSLALAPTARRGGLHHSGSGADGFYKICRGLVGGRERDLPAGPRSSPAPSSRHTRSRGAEGDRECAAPRLHDQARSRHLRLHNQQIWDRPGDVAVVAAWGSPERSSRSAVFAGSRKRVKFLAGGQVVLKWVPSLSSRSMSVSPSRPDSRCASISGSSRAGRHRG